MPEDIPSVAYCLQYNSTKHTRTKLENRIQLINADTENIIFPASKAARRSPQNAGRKNKAPYHVSMRSPLSRYGIAGLKHFNNISIAVLECNTDVRINGKAPHFHSSSGFAQNFCFFSGCFCFFLAPSACKGVRIMMLSEHRLLAGSRDDLQSLENPPFTLRFFLLCPGFDGPVKFSVNARIFSVFVTALQNMKS